ncbi:hypothetical protein CPB83DRAFT_59905 [Crepidotus variabilis]|uniref:Uncharacterized protein n=1 Tax=Crepidotus variabilis TaxID=179855 RepID=A0A9P6E619_9AGAR|nr:hypothetical protein CPB83DRAFT_59905 [Crepidotus variabilis]
MSPVSSSASTLLAENSSGRREGRSPSSSHRSDKRNEERSRHHSSKDPKAPRSKAVSLERDQKTPEQREKERKRRQRDRELAKEAAADLEYIQKWDDLGFSFGKKGKDKDKDKGKVDKGKEKEKKSMKLQETGGVANKDREKEKARDREKRRTEREMESDAQRQQTIAALGIGAAADGFIPHGIVPPIPISSNADSSSHGRSFSYSTIRQRNQASLQHPPKGLHFFDKTYIPGSNEEAENIGMRIVCAKFRVEKVTKATDKDPAGVVASSIKVVGENGRGQAEDDFGYGYLRRGDKDKEKRKKLEKEKKEQKGKEKTKFNEDMLEDKSKRPMTSSQHILNLADASISRGFPPRKASLPGLSLGFGSGKDKEKEKDKWAERSLEKAAKQKQKDRKKKKDHDNSGEDAPGVTGSGLSWKLGKKRKQAIDSDTEKDKSTTATEDDDGQTDDGIGVNDSGFRTTPQVRVQVQVETKAEGDIPKRPRLTVSTATIPKIAPVDDEGDDNSEVEFGLDRRRGYRYGGYHEEKMKKQQQRQTEMTEVAPGKSTLPSKENTAPKSPSKRRDNEKYEWIVLDMGSLAAYNSILRIFHRHFKPPMHSVFINTSPAVQGQPGAYDEPHYLSQDDESSEDHTLDKTTSSASHHPSALKPTRRRRAAATLALPYPEWRNQTVSRARSQGMLETGRPIELAMNRWGRDYELMTQEFRRQKERDSEWRRKFRQSYGQSQLAGDRKASIATIKVDKEEAAVEDEQDDDDAYLTADPILLDDSEEESEEEFARWWRDVPRQIEAEKERHLLEKQRELLDHENDSAGDPYDDLLFERRPLASSSYSLDPMLSTSSNLAGLLSTSARQPAPIFIKTTGLSAQINQQATPASPTALTPTPSTLKSPDTLLSSASTEVPIFGSPILSSAYSDGLHNFHSLPSLTAVSEDTAAPFISKETPASRFHEVPPSRSPQQERGRQFRLIRNLEPSAGASASSNTERGEDASSFDRESVKDRGENRLSTQSLDSPTAGYQFPPPKNISSYVNGQDLRPSSERTHDHKKLYEDDLQGRFYPRKASTSSSGHSHLSYEEESTISGHSHTRSGSLHHSVSRPSSSTPEHQTASSPLRNLPTQGSPLSQYRSSTSSPITSSLFGSPRARERTVTLPTNFGLSMAEMAIALGQSNPTAQVQRPLTGAGSVGIGDDNLDKPILTPEQIRQIENETLDAWVPPTEEETMIGLTITPTRSTPPMTFGSSSPPGSVGRSIGKRFPLRGLAGVRTPVRSGHASGSERDSDDEKVETVGGSVSKRGFSENAGLGVDDKFKNGTWAMFRTASNPTSPATATITPDHPWNSSVLSPSTSASNKISAQINQVDSQSAHAKDILRRVRSGSSLHLMPMGVHLELEENLEGEPPFSRSIMVDDDDSQGEEDGDDHGGSTGHDGLWLSNNDKWKHSTRNERAALFIQVQTGTDSLVSSRRINM